MPKMAKILVVDDEPAVLEVIQRILVDRGFWVDVANNGLEALELLEQASYDLMLSDVKMPHMDGMELLQQVSLLYPELITVMLSAFANIQDAVAAIKLGAHDYIAKPVYPEDLVFSIERALRFKELRQAAQELEWTLKGAEALGLQVLDLAPETEEFQVLEKLRSDVKQITDIRLLAKLFLQGAQKLTLASRGSIFLFDQEGIHLSCVAMSENQVDRINFKTLRPSEGVMSAVLQSGRPLLVADVALEPRFFNHQRSKRYDTKSFVVVPIVGEKTWGVINLADRCDLKAFSPRELFLVWLLARIFTETLQQREWEEKSRSINDDLQATRSELLDVKESFDRLTTSVPMGLALLDQKLRICFANPTLAKLFSQREPGTGKKILDYMKGISTSDYNKIKNCLKKIIQGERTIECGQITISHPEQGNSFCLLQLIKLNSSNAGLQIMLVFEDITEISQMQQRLSLYEHLAIMGKLSACVVHELNNPLDGVKRYISLAQIKKDHSEDVERYLTEAQKGLNKMSLAINSILNVANPNRILKSQDTLLSQLREAIKILLLQAKDQRVEITLSTSPIFEEVYFGTDLYTVFVNLIKNAIQAMSNGGQLEIIGFDHEDQIEIHFKDNGPGINQKNLKDIFKPFFTTKNQGQGLGLGLTICQKIVSRYQGLISVESSPEQGSKFIIRLPLSERFHSNAQND
jgi:nitrogen-specific signal transduction histidine kinase/DNA-binding response OmpR family regulator